MDPATAFTSTAAAISHGQVSELQLSEDYAIKSEAVTPKLGESSFPFFFFFLLAILRSGRAAGSLCLGRRQTDDDGHTDTSQWPLLLKNYDKLLIRSSHFTPIPTVRLHRAS